MIFIDGSDDYGAGERQTPLPGFLLASQPGQLVRFFENSFRRHFRILYKPESNVERHFEIVCKMMLRIRDCVIVAPEIWQFCDASTTPEFLKTIVLRGRRPGVALYWDAQRPATVSRTLTSQSRELRIFRLDEQADLDWISGRVPQEARRIIPTLPDHEFISVDKEKNWYRGKVLGNGTVRKVLGTPEPNP